MQRIGSIVLCCGLIALSFYSTLTRQGGTSGSVLIGLVGLIGLVHILTCIPIRVVGELLGKSADGECFQIRTSDRMVMKFKAAIENDDWKNLVGKQVVTRVIQSWVLPPTIFILELNTRVEQ